MRACASFGVSLVVRLGAMSVAFEGGIVSAGGLQYRQLPPAARPSARPAAVDALMDALDEQYEEDKSFTEMFDPAQSKVQCAMVTIPSTNSFHTQNVYKCHRMPHEHPTVQKSQLLAHRSVEFRTE